MNERNADSMSMREKFKLFGIDTNNLPPYSGAENYSQQFQQCSVLAPSIFVYSTQSTSHAVNTDNSNKN